MTSREQLASELRTFIEAALSEDARVAFAAIDPRAAGQIEHWHWACADDDEPVDVELAIASNAEYLTHPNAGARGHADEYGYRMSLRSTVDYPAGSVPGMGYGHLIIDHEELRPADARHLARFDPARILADVHAKRMLLDSLGDDVTRLRWIAYPYDTRPGWKIAWFTDDKRYAG